MATGRDTEDRADGVQQHQTDVAPCQLLSLPPELRNTIYKLTFAASSNTDPDLLHTEPPTKDLLLACRSLHQEARTMYKHAYRCYWNESHFSTTIRHEDAPHAARLVENLNDDASRRITIVELMIIGRTSGEALKYRYLGEGLWEYTSLRGKSAKELPACYLGLRSPLSGSRTLQRFSGHTVALMNLEGTVPRMKRQLETLMEDVCAISGWKKTENGYEVHTGRRRHRVASRVLD